MCAKTNVSKTQQCMKVSELGLTKLLEDVRARTDKLVRARTDERGAAPAPQ